MGISPQPPSPPGGLTNKHMLGTALIILGLIIGSAIIMIWIGLRFLAGNAHVQVKGQEGARREVTIKTPVGSLEVEENVNPARLGLPIYPGAVRAKTSDSATVNLKLPNDETLRVWAAKFETADSLEQVSKFYNQHLGREVTRYQARTREGKTVYEIKQGGEDRIVALETQGGKTWIQLARVLHGASEPN
ncbi:MAG TPA: hypothetical protein VNG91_07245 [Terriglobia bacterium]|nr:hypothetical protein [Terriglobia bacterium]